MNRRPPNTLAANPVLIGAATTLVVLVAMFLAYNANSGLPFVPTYTVDAVVPDAAELVVGNDVRIGGKRVGVVSAIDAQPDPRAPEAVSARVTMKLEKPLEPLPADTRVTVRPRSTLGLKYVELQPGKARAGIVAGGTIPLENAGEIVELDELFDTFDEEARTAFQRAVEPGAEGLASRGADVNVAIEQLRPVTRLLRPVARSLASPRTDLSGWIRGLEASATAFAPVTAQLGGLLDGAAVTLAALGRAEQDIAETVRTAPATEAVATRVLRTARPVLDDAAALARDLRPATRVLTAAGDRLAEAVETGTPVLRRGITLGPDLERALRAAGALARDPLTGGSLRGLRTVVASLEPTLRFLNPLQTECNYLGVWTRNAAGVISEGDETGNWFRFAPIMQTSEILQSAEPAPQLHQTPYGRFHGECEIGNEVYSGQQRVGSTPEAEPNRTEETRPPAGTPSEPAIPTIEARP